MTTVFIHTELMLRSNTTKEYALEWDISHMLGKWGPTSKRKAGFFYRCINTAAENRNVIIDLIRNGLDQPFAPLFTLAF